MENNEARNLKMLIAFSQNGIDRIYGIDYLDRSPNN